MAIIRSNTEAADAVPEIWLAMALQKFKDKIVLLNFINRDVRDSPAQKGDTISVNERGSLTAQDKTEGTPLTFQAPQNSKKSLVLNKHKVVPWAMEDVASSLAIDDAVDYIDDATDTLVEQIEDDVWAEYANASNTVGVAGQDINVSTILESRRHLQENNAPGDGRVFAMSTKDGENVLGIDKLTKANERGDGGEALRNASIGTAYGFNFFESNRVPTTGSDPTVHHNLALHPRAATIAMRPLKLPPAGTAVGAYIVDEDTGIILRMIQSYGHEDMGVRMTLDILYGLKTFHPELMVHVKS